MYVEKAVSRRILPAFSVDFPRAFPSQDVFTAQAGNWRVGRPMFESLQAQQDLARVASLSGEAACRRREFVKGDAIIMLGLRQADIGDDEIALAVKDVDQGASARFVFDL